MKKIIPILAIVYIFICFFYSAWADNHQNSLTASLCLQSDNLPLSASDYEEVGDSIIIKGIMKKVAGENFNGAQDASAVLIKLSDSDFFESAGEFRGEYKNEAEFYNAITDQFEIRNIPVSVNGYDVELNISKKEITSYLDGSYCLFTTVVGKSESGGIPHYFIYYNNIEGGSETLAYIIQSGNQVLKGNYTDDITILGTGTQVGAGILGVDLPMDLRDLAYDLAHWEWSWEHAGDTFLDGIGLIPVIGIVKNADEVAALIKARKVANINFGDKILKQLEKRGWTKKEVEELIQNPHETKKLRDTRNKADGSGKLDDPATGYLDKDGNYIIKNDVTNDIVQVSDKFDAAWLTPWE